MPQRLWLDARMECPGPDARGGRAGWRLEPGPGARRDLAACGEAGRISNLAPNRDKRLHSSDGICLMRSPPWFVRARLRTRQLMLLIAIEEHGNIHRAAESLNMSQPAASKLLKDLEDLIGVQLFE